MDGRIWFLSLYIDIYILYKPYMDMNKCILLYTNRMFVLLTFLFGIFEKNIRIQNCSTCLQIHCLPESMRNSCGLWKIIGKSLT